MKWRQVGKEINAQGTTITYWADERPITIESRRRHIPHANNRSGTWDHTSYFVLWKGHEVKEFWTLRDSKAFAETYKGE